jgi:hypothetical protein
MTRVALLAIAAFSCMIAWSSPSSAAILVTSTAFNLNLVPDASVIDFDKPVSSGFRVTGGVVRVTDDGFGSPPAVAPGVKGSSAYLSVNPGETAAIVSRTGFQSVSFLWGSMDSYNTLRLIGADGTTIASYSGLDVFAPADGGQLGGDTNRRVTFTVQGGPAIYGIGLESSRPAFEIDDVSFSGAVPEPATWAMMLLGLGIVGGAVRHRRKFEKSATFA